MGRIAGHFLMAVTAITLLFGGANGQGSASSNSAATAPVYECVTRFETQDWKLLTADLKATSPDNFKKLNSDPEFRSKQVESLRELFAYACQAVKNGALNDPLNIGELESIRNEVVAIEFEELINKPLKKELLSSVSNVRVESFYKVPENEARFEDFLNGKLELRRRNGAAESMKATDEERSLARTTFAKFALLVADSKLRATKLEPGFFTRVGLTIKLQQAQFLAKIAAEKNAAAVAVSDDEVNEYIRNHPEFATETKKAKAQSILARALAGENFAKLADEFSDDPGNVAEDGTKSGGLYRDVPEERMLPAFEKAALALQAGKISPQLTETDFGYHVIKLEKKSGTAGSDGPDKLAYDVRHILISTGVKDPADPDGREVPPRQFVRTKLENEKEEVLKSKILRENPVVMADIPVPPAAPAKPRPGTRKPGN